MQQHQATRQITQSTCLIVEGSPFDQQMMMRVINHSHQRMQIKVAGTLRAARRAITVDDVTLILLDNNLPDGVGANFALELSETPEYASIPIILMSDWPTPFMWEKAAAAGVAFIVNKAEFGVRYVDAALRRGARNTLKAG